MATKINIIIDCRILDTGIGRYLKNLLFFLYKNHANEINLKLIGPKNSIEEFFKEKGINGKNIQIVDFSAPIYSIQEQIILPRIINRILEDNEATKNIVFVPHYNVPLCLKNGTNLVVTIHDITPLKFPNWFSPIRSKILEIVLKSAFKKAKKIITVSNYIKQDLIKYFSTIKDLERKIEVIYNGFNPEEFSPLPEEEVNKILEKYSLPKKKYLLFVGRRKEHKNIDRLIVAFKRILEDFPDMFLVIVGPKLKEEDFVDKTIEREEVTGRVICIDGVRDKELIGIYQSARLFVFPSLSEGFGFPPLEAMSLGVPVVASNTSSIPEVVNNSAVLVNPYDVDDIYQGIKKVLEDPILEKEIVERGKERVKFFRWEETVEKLLYVFSSI